MSNHTIVIPTPDLAAATAFYTAAWGTEPHTETPYYVGFNLDGQEIGLNPNGERDQMTGPVVYWMTDDLDGQGRRGRGGRRDRRTPGHGGRRRDVAGAADRPGGQPGRLHHPGLSLAAASSSSSGSTPLSASRPWRQVFQCQVR